MKYLIFILLVLPIMSIGQISFDSLPDEAKRQEINKFINLNFVDIDETDREIAPQLNKIDLSFNKSYTNDINFSQPAGYYTNIFKLGISDLEGDAIYYTINGDIPDQNSNKYTDSILIDMPIGNQFFEATVIRARTFLNNEPTSKTYTQSYLVDSNMYNKFSMPIVSLITQESNLYDYDTGIFVKGVNYDSSNPTWTGNYFETGIEWERDVYIQYFTKEGELVIDQDAGVRIHGGRQRAADQKSLRLYARSEYGENSFDYQLLPQKNKDEYKRFLLNSSFGGFSSTIIKDQMASSLVRETDIEMQDFRPVIVLINGDYWGIQHVRDYLGQHHFANKYNIDKDSVAIGFGFSLTNVEGDVSDYISFVNSFIDTADMSKQYNFEYLKTKIDFDEYLNYMNTEIYLNNYDWPGSNIRYWFSKQYDGKFKWILYDLDGAFSQMYGDASYNMLDQATVPTDSWPNPSWSTLLLTTFLNNDEFKNEFIARQAYLMNYYFDKDTIVPVINDVRSLYEPEYQEHADRWGVLSYSSWQSTIDTKLIAFAQERRPYVEQHYINKFGLSGTSELTADVNDHLMGKIYINRMPIPYQNSTGKYFNDIYYTLNAIPEHGYKFIKWVNSQDSLNSELVIQLSTDSSVTAIFEPDTSVAMIYINEVMAKNNADVMDNMYQYEDWVEIYNDNDSIVDLAGLYLTDDYSMPFKWRIPDCLSDSSKMQAYGFKTFFLDNDTSQGCLHTSFKLKATNDKIALVKNADGFPVFIDSMSFYNQIENISFGRCPDGDTNVFLLSNTTSSASNIHQYISNIYINEVLSSNLTGVTNEYLENEDWIEIYNNNNFPVDLGGVFITDNTADPTTYKIPSIDQASTIIPAYGFKLIFADDDSYQGILHANFKLSQNGEEVGIYQLFNDTMRLIDTVSFNYIPQDMSYGRKTDASSIFQFFNNPTPEYSNTTITSLNQSVNNQYLSIYPNPTIGEIYIDGEGVECVEIINCEGKQIYIGKETRIDFNQKPKGIYIIKVTTDKQTITSKLIKR